MSLSNFMKDSYMKRIEELADKLYQDGELDVTRLKENERIDLITTFHKKYGMIPLTYILQKVGDIKIKTILKVIEQ